MRHAPALCAALLLAAACGDTTGPGNEDRCTPSVATGTIAMGQTRSESLSESDCLLPNDTHGDGWELTLDETTVVQVNLTSEDFDALVVITDEDFDIVALDDDSGTGTNASLITSLAPGTYMVWATSFDDGGGSYDLTLGPALAPACLEETPTGSIAVGESVEGELDPGDCLMANGTVAERWQITVDASETVRVDLRSAVFDAYLYISDETGVFIAANDDTDGIDSRIQLTLEPGTYLLWASSFAPTAGAFELSVTAAALPAGGVRAAAQALRFEALRSKPDVESTKAAR